MSEEITELEPRNPAFLGLLRNLPGARHEWLEDTYVSKKDCPRCYVCEGRRVWPGFWWNFTNQPSRACLVCGGFGRMPFIYPPGQ